MRRILIGIIMLAVVGVSFGQRGNAKFKITGRLLDEGTDAPLEFATISLLNASDSSLVDGAITGSDGTFTISPKSGDYILKLQFISYSDQYRSISLNRNQPVVNIGDVSLSADTETLREVVITGAKDQMQLELDKRVFNVGENLANIGANATEVLEQIPSVAIDVDGNVSLRGSNNVRILVNGKPSGLVGIGDQDGLRQLQGDIIERIEVVTNPSARYDAEGSAGIINIILKKDRQKGFNGAFTANVGVPQNYGFSGNANYRSGSFNLFASYGIRYNENPGGGFTDRKSIDDDTVTYTYIDNDRNRTGLSHNFRAGFDYYINDNNIITAAGLIRISDEENTSELTYFDRDENRTLFNNEFRRDVEIEDDDNYEYELSYQRIFKGEGHELNAQFQYRNNDETEDSEISEQNLLANEQLIPYQKSLNIQGDKNILIQADYVYPITEEKKLETGYRGTIRSISSDYEVREKNADGDFVPIEEVIQDLQLSNRFEYDEDVHAAYAIFENKMDKWGYQLGLRLEQTFIDLYQREGDLTDEKEYLNAFPSAFLSYKLTDTKTLQGSYSRRIQRPRFWYLNPFSSFTDPRNLRRGNTDLDPSYTDSYELGLLNNLKKASIYVGTYYRFTTGTIERISLPFSFLGQASTISTPYNIGTEDAIGIEANMSADPWRWFNINGNLNIYNAQTTGEYRYTIMDTVTNETAEEVINLERETFTANFRLNTRFKLGNVDLQVSGFYRAPQQTVQGERKSIYAIDFGANMDVLNNRGTLTLSVRDLFNTRKYRGTLDTPVLTEEREFQWRSRQARLSFTYRINQKKKRDRGGRDDDGGDDDF